MSIIDFQKAKQKVKQRSYASGEAKCLACGHKWIAVKPISTDNFIECPKCETNFGRFINHFQRTGELHWTCGCGNDLFFITPDETYCPVCGNPQAGF